MLLNNSSVEVLNLNRYCAGSLKSHGLIALLSYYILLFSYYILLFSWLHGYYIWIVLKQTHSKSQYQSWHQMHTHVRAHISLSLTDGGEWPSWSCYILRFMRSGNGAKRKRYSISLLCNSQFVNRRSSHFGKQFMESNSLCVVDFHS